LNKPLLHPSISSSKRFQIEHVKVGSEEHESILKLTQFQASFIDSIFRISNMKLWRAYLKQRSIIAKRIDGDPHEQHLFHMTDYPNAERIVNSGFQVFCAKALSFGKGIYLANTAKETLKYGESFQSPTIIITQVCIGKAHPNSSDITKIVYSPDGYAYSKPRFLKPRRGYDAMHSNDLEKSIWVIPSAARVYPSYVLRLRKK